MQAMMRPALPTPSTEALDPSSKLPCASWTNDSHDATVSQNPDERAGCSFAIVEEKTTPSSTQQHVEGSSTVRQCNRSARGELLGISATRTMTGARAEWPLQPLGGNQRDGDSGTPMSSITAKERRLRRVAEAWERDKLAADRLLAVMKAEAEAAMQANELAEWESDCDAQFESQFPRDFTDGKTTIVKAQLAQGSETEEDSFEKVRMRVATDWNVVDDSNNSDAEDACTDSIPTSDRSNVASRPQTRKRSNRLGERLLRAKQAKTGDESDGYVCTKTLL